MEIPSWVSKKDRREIEIFSAFLKAKKKYGFDKMIKHRYWRKYMGFE